MSDTYHDEMVDDDDKYADKKPELIVDFELAALLREHPERRYPELNFRNARGLWTRQIALDSPAKNRHAQWRIGDSSNLSKKQSGVCVSPTATTTAARSAFR